ncbi:MAG: efflux RND transporter permease subunit, partial [Spirochaetales bacterium]|nr:efflux RND transporter permease subunit [Spirochaetales bacterium]
MFRRISLLCIPCLLFAFLLQSPDFSYYPERAQKFISIRTRLDEEESIEKKITAPLEEELLRVKGVAEISSLSGRGESRITLLLDEDQNLDDAYLEVRERVQRVSAHYPDTAGTPMLLKSQSSSSPVFVLAIPPETDISADRLKSLFQSVRGTGEIEISSASNPEVHIECSPGLLSSLKLSSADLGIRIAENNALSAVHRDTGILLMDQRIKSLVDFGSIPVNNGFLLADAGQITLTGAEQRSISELNGAPGQVMWISKTGSANVIRLCRKLRAKTADLEGSRVLYDRGALIEEALSGLFLTLGLSCASVFLVTAIFIRKFRELLLLCLNIPFSLAGTMALLTLAGQDINLSVLAGLALCSGMIIDSGVIVLEQGLKPALKPLTASLVSTILVLSPLIFASPSLKILCLPLAAAVSICLTLSFLYILIILGGSGRMSRDLYKSSFRLPTAGRGLEALPMIILLLTFPAFLSLGRLRYREEIDLADRTLGFSVEFEAGRTKERVREGLKRVDAFLRASDVPEYYSSSYSDERGRFLIKLGKESDREKIRRQIIAEAGIIRGYLSFDDSPAEESYLIRIKGEDRNELKRVSDDLARYLESQSGEYQVVLGYKEQPDTLLITTDNLKCSAAGISPERIAGYLLLAQNPPVLGKWLPPGVGELRDIRITGS